QDQRHYPEAEALFREALARIRQINYPKADLRLGVAMNLGRSLVGQRKYAEAEPVLRETVADLDRLLPRSPLAPQARGLLGEALLGLDRYADAEPLLLAHYAALERRSEETPSPSIRTQLTESAQRLVRLYDAWGKPDEAEKWRGRLAPRS